MKKSESVGTCKYCYDGLTFDSMLCDECASTWSWTGCTCCGDMIGKMTDAGIHERCE